jgi:hypothetical protein
MLPRTKSYNMGFISKAQLDVLKESLMLYTAHTLNTKKLSTADDLTLRLKIMEGH